MFDSENNSLVTRVEAGAGIIVTYNTNSEGENVWTATLDSDYVAAIVTNNAGGTLTLSAYDESRLAAVERAVGTLTEDPYADPVAPTQGTGGTTTIENFQMSPSTSQFTRIVYNLVSFDGTVLTSQEIAAEAGTTVEQLMLALWANIKQNNSMMLHIESVTYSGGIITIVWNYPARGSTMTFDLLEFDPSDEISFDVNNY